MYETRLKEEARPLTTLEQKNYYDLSFSNPIPSFKYQKAYFINMGYDKISELKEAFSADDANKQLKKKFKLLKILQTRRTTNNFDETRPCYILGK